MKGLVIFVCISTNLKPPLLGPCGDWATGLGNGGFGALAGGQTLPVVHTVSYLMVTGPLSRRVKRLKRVAGHLPLSNNEIKNERNCTFTPPLCFHDL